MTDEYSEDKSITRECLYCHRPFIPRSTGGKLQRYCSAECRILDWNVKNGRIKGETVTSTIPPNLNGGRLAVCEQCGISFTTRKRGGGRRQRFCSESCSRLAYNERNPQVWREHVLLRKYGMTMKDYQSMLEFQEGKCAICKRPPKNNILAVDHDHETGQVRGLLCSPCNRHVGYFEMWGQQVIEYLKYCLYYPQGFSSESSINRQE